MPPPIWGLILTHSDMGKRRGWGWSSTSPVGFAVFCCIWLLLGPEQHEQDISHRSPRREHILTDVGHPSTSFPCPTKTNTRTGRGSKFKSQTAGYQKRLLAFPRATFFCLGNPIPKLGCHAGWTKDCTTLKPWDTNCLFRTSEGQKFVPLDGFCKTVWITRGSNFQLRFMQREWDGSILTLF